MALTNVLDINHLIDTSMKTTQPGYVISAKTGRWLDCLVAVQAAYTKILSEAELDEDVDLERLDSELTGPFRDINGKITELMNQRILQNLGDMDNLKKAKPEV